jgi:hypothetical protein
MTWDAKTIYAKPSPDVAAALAREPFLAKRMFFVDSLDGARFEWARRLLLSDSPPDDAKHMRHGLPEEGLLVIWLYLTSSGYDNFDPPTREFRETFHDNQRPWPIVSNVELPPALLPPDTTTEESRRLLGFLRSVALETRSPIVYYHGATWGGAVDFEIGWAFDVDDHVYQYVDDDTVLHHTSAGQTAVQGKTVVQLLMAHLGLRLPTGFFALHEGSFDWKRYWLQRD